MRELFAPGSRNDPAIIGEGTASMLSLNALLYRVLSSVPAVVPSVNTIALVGMALILGTLIHHGCEQGRLLLICSAFTLLVSYHRVYDAILLLPGIAWLIDRTSPRLECENLVLVALLMPFLVPGPALLQVALPDQLQTYWPVYAVAIPHETWCLLALFVVASWRPLIGSLVRYVRPAQAIFARVA